MKKFFLCFFLAAVFVNSQAADETPARLRFSELYSSGGGRGLVFSEKLRSLNGGTVVMSGYMAPPLKPALDFFVLTRQPLAICPFCDSDASWPADIVLVYLQGGRTATATLDALEVTGRLELGSYTDPVTGFVSQIRIYADSINRVR
jgi:hypothetical protein